MRKPKKHSKASLAKARTFKPVAARVRPGYKQYRGLVFRSTQQRRPSAVAKEAVRRAANWHVSKYRRYDSLSFIRGHKIVNPEWVDHDVIRCGDSSIAMDACYRVDMTKSGALRYTRLASVDKADPSFLNVTLVGRVIRTYTYGSRSAPYTLRCWIVTKGMLGRDYVQSIVNVVAVKADVAQPTLNVPRKGNYVFVEGSMHQVLMEDPDQHGMQYSMYVIKARRFHVMTHGAIDGIVPDAEVVEAAFAPDIKALEEMSKSLLDDLVKSATRGPDNDGT